MIEYFIKRGNRVKGPYLLDDLKNIEIDNKAYVRMDDDPEWRLIREVDDLRFLLQIQDEYNEYCDEPTHPADKNSNSSSKGGKAVVLIATTLLFLIALGLYLFLGISPI